MNRRDFNHLSTFPLSYICRHRVCPKGIEQRTFDVVVEAYEHALDRINSGDNAFDVWGSFCGFFRNERADVFGLNPEQYQRFAERSDYIGLSGENVMDFCLKTQIHPADLIPDDVPFIPAPIMEALLVVGNHSESLYEDQRRARSQIEMELLRYADLPEWELGSFEIADGVYEDWLQYLKLSLSEERRVMEEKGQRISDGYFFDSFVRHWDEGDAYGRLDFARPYFSEAVRNMVDTHVSARQEVSKIDTIVPLLFQGIANSKVSMSFYNPTNVLLRLNLRRDHLLDVCEASFRLHDAFSYALTLGDRTKSVACETALTLYDNRLKIRGYDDHLEYDSEYDPICYEHDPMIVDLLERGDIQVRDLYGEPEQLEDVPVTCFRDYRLL